MKPRTRVVIFLALILSLAGVAAIARELGAREARDKACPNRIGAIGHHDRNRLRLLFDRRDRRVGVRYDHVHLQAYQLGRDLGHPFGPVVGEPALHDDVLPFYIPMLSQALREWGVKSRSSSWRACMENADAGDLLRRLRVRPFRRPARRRARRARARRRD